MKYKGDEFSTQIDPRTLIDSYKFEFEFIDEDVETVEVYDATEGGIASYLQKISKTQQYQEKNIYTFTTSNIRKTTDFVFRFTR